MKIRSKHIPVTAKAFFVITCIILGFGSFATCDAQSVVGKWKGVSVKNYYSDAYAKQAGKSMDEKTAKEIGNSIVEYKTDHSFVITFSALNDPKVTTMNGVWSQEGDRLKLTMEPMYNPRKTTTTATISISGSTMLVTALIPPPSRIIKSISTCTKM
jgi:hypothetical protein